MWIYFLPRFHIKECRYRKDCSVMALTPPYDAMGRCVLVIYLFLDRPCHFCSYSSDVQVLFWEDWYERHVRAPMWS
jgi:hypothetical protein